MPDKMIAPGINLLRTEQIQVSDVASVVEHMHDISMDMSLPPETRAQARLMKVLLPGVMEWLTDEHKRDSTIGDVILATETTLANIVIHVANAVCRERPQHIAHAMRSMCAHMKQLVETQAKLADAAAEAGE
jgi:hypothetical protein